MRSKANLGLVVAMGLVICLAVRPNEAAVREADSQMQSPSVKGDLTVNYELVYADGGNSAESDKACTQIDFHENYVVMRYKSGGGRLLPLGQIKRFYWSGR